MDEHNGEDSLTGKVEDPHVGPGKALGPAALPAWKKVLFSALSTVLFFVLLEAALALAGVQARLRLKDPFVGFVSTVPLFVEKTDSDGRTLMVTAANKKTYFNYQQFPLKKQPGTYRIFCLGGSTTYGRPYFDKTSFCGWLRELLPVADPSRQWEVVNAGGISYASYRVARLMEELLEYEPDLFIVYTGHNEFLEERTYGELRDLPGAVKSAANVFARTRTWTAMSSLLERLRPTPKKKSSERDLLPSEVQAKLDRSAGLLRYRRDDALQEKILAHYRFSLKRMTGLARTAGAGLLFVTPASNLKDFSPFKNQHTGGLDRLAQRQSEELLSTAQSLMHQSREEEALSVLDEALAVDPRLALLNYLRGKALLALGRYEEAKVAFSRARDEDVLPLRALSPMKDIVQEVARKTRTPLVDFAHLVEQESISEGGHGIPGQGCFLDHVHPSIKVHRLLAVSMVEKMTEMGVVRPSPVWGGQAIAEVASRVESSLDPLAYADSLANLAKTLDWAGRKEESRRLAFKALELGSENASVLMMAGREMAKEGKIREAIGYFRRAVKAIPDSSNIHSQFGMLLAGLHKQEAAAAHFFLASLLKKADALYHRQLGYIMAQRGRFKAALASYLQALRLNPANQEIAKRVADIRSKLGADVRVVSPPRIQITRYESGYPRTLAQMQPDSSGRYVLDGIWTEWDKKGNLKRFIDYSGGVPHGVSVTWDKNGGVAERAVYSHGTLVRGSGD